MMRTICPIPKTMTPTRKKIPEGFFTVRSMQVRDHSYDYRLTTKKLNGERIRRCFHRCPPTINERDAARTSRYRTASTTALPPAAACV